jgi:hypothetical protein
MTKFTPEQQAYLEANVTMTGNYMACITGDVGTILGDVLYVNGDVLYHVRGDVQGDVTGDVIGTIAGTVHGDVVWGVRGTTGPLPAD